jgi:hypothetical protein
VTVTPIETRRISAMSDRMAAICSVCFFFQISSLNLLRVISEQEGVPIEELNAGRVCDWFLKDKLKREQNVGTAVLQWDDPGF